MAELKKGDRIRLTVEGRVTDPSLEDGFRFETDLDEWIIEGTVDYTVEVLDPKPFPVHSVAYDGSYPLIRKGDGWYGRFALEKGQREPTCDDRWVRKSGFVVHEPPTS